MFTAKVYSSITTDAEVLVWWNGRHKGLKIPALLGVLVQVQSRVPSFDSKDKLFAVLKEIVRKFLSLLCRQMSATNDWNKKFEVVPNVQRLKILKQSVTLVLQPQKPLLFLTKYCKYKQSLDSHTSATIA